MEMREEKVEELDEKTKVLIERIERNIEERIKTSYKDRLVDVNTYVDDMIWTAEMFTNSKCKYQFDDKPIIMLEYRDNDSYVRKEIAVDTIKCEEYDINIAVMRLVIRLGNHHLQEIREISHVSAYKK